VVIRSIVTSCKKTKTVPPSRFRSGWAKPTRKNQTKPGISINLSGDQFAGPGIAPIGPIVGAHEEQPLEGTPPVAQPESQGGGQVGQGWGCARAPRNNRGKHDAQPTADTNRTNIAITVNSLRMICSLEYCQRLETIRTFPEGYGWHHFNPRKRYNDSPPLRHIFSITLHQD